jgi:hypothetical protein
MGGLLQASFVRVPGQRDRIYVHRSDGSEVSWLFPSYGDGLPHDLVHLVVESAFGLRQGFWGRVDAGIDPGRISDEANRMGGADKYRGFGEDRRELAVAEGLAAAPWFDAEKADADRRDAMVEACVRSGLEPPATLTPERVAEARVALEGLRARWRAFGGKGTLKLRFRPDDPQRGFAEMLVD